jgi:ankyrin repeat protein
MRYLIEVQRRWLQRRQATKENEALVAFFFCSSNDPLRSNYFHFLSSILHQILSQKKELFRYLDDSTLEQYTARIDEEQNVPSEISTDLLKESLSTILQRSKDVSFWIFVDATDELTAESRDALLNHTGEIIQQDILQKVKLVLSDRVRYCSRRFKHNCIEVEMQGSGETGEDVHRFITTKVEDLCTDGVIPWQHQTEIEETFIELSEGNFLQASLAWKNFFSGVSYWSPQVIKTRLEGLRKISKEATAYYCSLLERIPEDSREVAKQGFTWVLGSRKPLSVSELQHAVAIGAGQRSWADLVESLGFNFEVQFDQAFGYLLRVEPDRSVRFTHSTIKELLTSSPQNLSPPNSNILSRFAIRECDIDAEIAKACIIILSFRDFGRLRNIAQEVLTDEVRDALARALKGNKRLGNINLSKYDDGNDSQGSDSDVKSSELRRRNKLVHIDDHSLFQYCVAHWNYHCSQGGSSPEVVASLTRFALLRQSYFSHLVAMVLGKAKVHKGTPWDSIDQFARVPPLHLMMRIGDHPAVVKSLIDRGQNINGTDISGWKPLAWAALENRKDSLQLLLAQDNITLGLQEGKPRVDNVIHLACKGGANTDIIQSLIDDPRADINATGKDGWTVLHWCLPKASMLTIAQNLLSRKDLDINAQDKNLRTYLDRIFHDGLYESLALKLISRWDVPSNWFDRTLARNPNSLNEERPQMSFLHTAAVLQWRAIERVILQTRPMEALKPEPDGMNLLERYAFHGIEDGLRNVLDILPGIFSHGNNSMTRLLYLCAQQDLELVVQQLRTKYDVDDTIPDEKGRTLAHWASEFHWKSIPSLVKHKAAEWLNQKVREDKTALHVAAEHRNKQACEALLKAGADYMIRDKHQRLPIHVAAEEGHGSIVLLFLNQPFHKYGKDQQGRHLLHLLVMWQSDAFIRHCLRLLHWKIDVVDKSRRSPLHYAAIFGNWPAVKILLEIGSNPNLKDGLGNYPLHYALSSGSRSCAQPLLQSGADIHSLDMFKRNALHLALGSENTELIDFVLQELGGDAENLRIKIHQKDHCGQTPLYRICQWNTTKYKPVKDYDDDDDGEDEMMFDIDLYDSPGYIMWKMSCDRVRKYIRILKALGANINTRDKYGNTPLHVATKSGNEVAVKTLSEFQEIETSVKDGNGYTLLDWAMVDGRRSIANALRRRGAKHSEGWKTQLRPLYTPWVDELTLEDRAPADWSLTTV